MIEYWQQADLRESRQDSPRRRAVTPLPTARRARQARTRRRREQELAAAAPRVSSVHEIQPLIDRMYLAREAMGRKEKKKLFLMRASFNGLNGTLHKGEEGGVCEWCWRSGTRVSWFSKHSMSTTMLDIKVKPLFPELH